MEQGPRDSSSRHYSNISGYGNSNSQVLLGELMDASSISEQEDEAHERRLQDFQVVESRINAYIEKFCTNAVVKGRHAQRQLLISIQVRLSVQKP